MLHGVALHKDTATSMLMWCCLRTVTVVALQILSTLISSFHPSPSLLLSSSPSPSSPPLPPSSPSSPSSPSLLLLSLPPLPPSLPPPSVAVKQIQEVRRGRSTDSFKSASQAASFPEETCFSLIYLDGGKHLALDLVAVSGSDAEAWVTGLETLIREKG